MEYSGPIPEKETFGTNSLITDNFKRFEEWYETERGQIFDMKSVLDPKCRLQF